MQKGILNRLFKIAVFILLASSLMMLLLFDHMSSFQVSRFWMLAISIIIVVFYILIYRKNNLLCFETLFFLTYVLSVYFDDIILGNLTDYSNVSSVLFQSFTDGVSLKSLIISIMALLAFIEGSIIVSDKYKWEESPNWTEYAKPICKNKYAKSSKILSVVLALYIIVLYFNQTIASWFHYSGNVMNEYSNSSIMMLTSIFLTLTIIEFLRLAGIGCNTFRSFLRNSNKVYLFDLILISGLLLISGNRNECLLILLPAILAFSIYIKKISNRQFLICFFIGAIAMTFVGVTRQTGILSDDAKQSNMTLFEYTRDFATVDMNTMYIVSYTDQKGPVYFKNATITLLSSIPFVGGLTTSIFELTPDVRSTILTTEGMQSRNNMDSGLGTSLVGDLYYTASWPFVFLYMFIFGWLMSYLYIRFTFAKKNNIFLMMLFLFNFANVVYCIRAEWTMPFRYIGFAFVIYLMIGIFQTRKS